MPRQPRRDAPGAVHHVMFRGIEKRRIFRDDVDRRDLVGRLARLVPEEGFRCFAWVLMPNHGHLLLKTGATPLSRLMARLLTGYAGRFNLRHRRAGHLFQNRFKSVVVERESHLRTLVPYIHLNPVRAGIVPGVKALASHPWTGHAALMGRRPSTFVATEEVLGWFANVPSEARTTLARWMEEGLEAERPPGSGGLAGRTPMRVVRRPRAPIAELPEPLERLLTRVCARVGASRDCVLGGRRQASTVVARSIVAHLAIAELGLPVGEVAEALNLDAGATSRAATRGRALLARVG